MVATGSRNDDMSSHGSSTCPGQPRPPKQARRVSSASQEARSRYLSDIRKRYRLKGFSIKATDLILKSWRQSTLKQYVVYAKLWYRFAMQGLRPTLRNIVEFLVHLHSKGFTHDQICSARSAVAVISDVENIGKHPDIKRLMKGLFESNPTYPKYTCVWDVQILFNYLRKLPHQSVLPVKILCKKLAILLSLLAGGQRSQTIHKINILDIKINPEKCVIPIYDPVKQTRRGKHMKPMEFKVYPEEEKLCVIHNLTEYLQKTRSVRRYSALFLSYQRPYHAITKDTVTRWVNDMMIRAGIDMTRYVTHSCRAAASSFAKKRLVPVKKIMNACGWSSEGTFANHYHKDIINGRTIGEDMLEEQV